MLIFQLPRIEYNPMCRTSIYIQNKSRSPFKTTARVDMYVGSKMNFEYALNFNRKD